MPIIIISSDTREMERQIAEALVKETGYTPLDRGFLEEIATQDNIEKAMLEETLNTVPSLLKKLSESRWRYLLACIEAAVLTRFLDDRIVCYGLSASLYVHDVSHVIKVRILTGRGTPDNREGSPQKTLLNLIKVSEKEMQHQKKWSMAAYKMDESDPSNYDMLLKLDQIALDEAVKTIIDAVSFRKFQPMTYSQKCLADQALAAKVRAVLIKSISPVTVEARDGVIVVETKVMRQKKQKRIARIKELAGTVPGVRYVEVHVNTNIISDGIL